MKRIFIVALAAFMFVPSAFAATIYSETFTEFLKNQTKYLQPLNITAEADAEITAEHGINLFLLDDIREDDLELLWDAVDSLRVSGSAVDNGKIATDLSPTYKNDYRVMHIPVLEDFAKGESVTIELHRLRAYDQTLRFTYIQLDTDGDLESDASDVNKIEVLDQEGTDFTPPYPITNVEVTPAEDLESVQLSWDPSPDYDAWGSTVDRTRVRNGVEQTKALLTSDIVTSYTDTDVTQGDKLTYEFYSNDGRNFSEKVVKTLTLEPASPETPADEDDYTPAIPEAESDVDRQDRLFNYYKTRHAIKCMPSGVSVPENNAACLWAQIDLVYAQEILGRSDVDLSLSERELYLIGIRLPYSQQRYTENCENASQPESYCPALGRAVNKAQFLLDQQ